MDDNNETPYNQAWFFGPLDIVITKKIELEGNDEIPADARCKAIHPKAGDPPRIINVRGTMGAFRVTFLKTEPINDIEGLESAIDEFGIPVLGTS